MAYQQYGVTKGGGIKDFWAPSTDAAETYPDSSVCKAGSTLITIDTTTHTVVSSLWFDGTNWNTI